MAIVFCKIIVYVFISTGEEDDKRIDKKKAHQKI